MRVVAYALLWTLTAITLVAPYAFIALFGLSRAIEGDTIGPFEILVSTVPTLAFLIGVVWLWTLRPSGRKASLVVGGGLVLLFGAWLAVSAGGQLEGYLLFGAPILVHALVLLYGMRARTRAAFERC